MAYPALGGYTSYPGLLGINAEATAGVTDGDLTEWDFWGVAGEASASLSGYEGAAYITYSLGMSKAIIFEGKIGLIYSHHYLDSILAPGREFVGVRLKAFILMIETRLGARISIKNGREDAILIPEIGIGVKFAKIL